MRGAECNTFSQQNDMTGKRTADAKYRAMIQPFRHCAYELSSIMSDELPASARPLQTVAEPQHCVGEVMHESPLAHCVGEAMHSALLRQHSAAALQHSRARINHRLPIVAFAAERRKIAQEEIVMRACPCSPRLYKYCKHESLSLQPALA